MLLLSVCDTSAFLFAKFFCRQDGGIALHPPTSPSPQPSQKHINRLASHHHPCLPSKKGEVLLLGQAEPTMVGIEINRSIIFKTSKQSQSLPQLASHHPFQNRTIPRKPPILLPPLSKGGGLTARHKLLLCCICLRYIRLFLFTKLFCRQDGGIALHPPTSPSPQPSQKHINRLASHHHPCLPSKKGEVLLLGQAEPTMVGIEINRSIIFKTSKQSQSLPQLASHHPFQNRTIPRKPPILLPPLSKVRCCRPKKFGRLPEGLPHRPH